MTVRKGFPQDPSKVEWGFCCLLELILGSYKTLDFFSLMIKYSRNSAYVSTNYQTVYMWIWYISWKPAFPYFVWFHVIFLVFGSIFTGYFPVFDVHRSLYKECAVYYIILCPNQHMMYIYIFLMGDSLNGIGEGVYFATV